MQVRVYVLLVTANNLLKGFGPGRRLSSVRVFLRERKSYSRQDIQGLKKTMDISEQFSRRQRLSVNSASLVYQL